MTFDQIVYLFILISASLLYATHWLPFEVTAVLIVSSLALTGILTPKEAVSGFSSTATLTVGAMFVLSGGLIRTGALEHVTINLARFSKGNPRRLLLLLAIAVPLASAFVNDTPVVVMLVPVILSLSAQFNIRPSRLLLPLSYFAVLGGTLSLLGTATNILLDDLYRQAGGPGFGMFEFTPLGLIYAAVGGIFIYFFGQRLLPDRASLSGLASNGLASTYISEIEVSAGSELPGRPVEAIFERVARIGHHVALPQLQQQHRRLSRSGMEQSGEKGAANNMVELLAVFRDGTVYSAEETLTLLLEVEDILIVTGKANEIARFLESTNSSLAPVLADSKREPASSIDQKVVEAVVLPDSRLNDRLVGDLELNRLYGVKILGIQHRGRQQLRGLLGMRVLSGDVLLLQGEPSVLQTASETEKLMLVEGVDRSILRAHKNRLALLIMLTVILLATFSSIPIVVLALTGAALMVVTKCLRIDEALRSLEPATLLLLVGAIPMGLAMETTGLAQSAVDLLLHWFGAAQPVVFLSIFYLLTNLLAQFISAKAVAVLFAPIALNLALTLGINPTSMMIAIVFGTAASFLTPMGHQVNAIVMGPGGYSFADYVRIGLPMTILMWLVATLCIPIFWPL